MVLEVESFADVPEEFFAVSPAARGQVRGAAAEFEFDLADAADPGAAGEAIEIDIFHIAQFEPDEGLFFLPAQFAVESSQKFGDADAPEPEADPVDAFSGGQGDDSVKEPALEELPHPVALIGHESQ